MQSSGLPRTIDLSREFKSDRGGVSSTDLWTTLKVVEFADRTLLFVMNLKRVGHIMQINFPQLHQTLGANFPGRPPECYDLKTVLGPDTPEYDFMAVRVAKILVKNKRFQKSTWLMLGLDNPDDQAYVHEIVDCIDQYCAEGVAN